MTSQRDQLVRLAHFPVRNPRATLAAAAAIVSTTALLVKTRSASTKTGKHRLRLFSSDTPISDDSVALDHLLAAFGPDGRNAQGTAPGCMVASPSKKGDGDSNNYW